MIEPPLPMSPPVLELGQRRRKRVSPVESLIGGLGVAGEGGGGWRRLAVVE